MGQGATPVELDRCAKAGVRAGSVAVGVLAVTDAAAATARTYCARRLRDTSGFIKTLPASDMFLRGAAVILQHVLKETFGKRQGVGVGGFTFRGDG